MEMKALAVFVVACAMAGCAASRDDDFGQVHRLVRERSGAQVQWNDGGEADRKVAEQIGGILSKPMSADEVVQVALLNQPRVQAVYQRVGVAQADLVEAGLLRNPVFDAEVRFPEGGGGTNVELSVAASFIDVLFLPARKRVAEAELERVKLEVADEVLDFAAEVQSAYYELQGAMQMLELHENVIAAAEASAVTAQRMLEAGNLSELDQARQQALAEEAKLELSRAAAEVQQDREKLAALMGLSDGAIEWSIANRLPPLPAEEPKLAELHERALNDRLDIAAAKREIDARAKALGLSRKTRYIDETEIGASAERESEGDWSIGPTISLPIPIFNFGQARVARARAEFRAAEENYRAMVNDARSEVTLAQKSASAARQRAEYLHRVVLPLRQKITQHSQLHYNGMLLGLFELLDAKQEEIRAGSEYIEALREYWVARAQLDRAVGGRVTTGAPTTAPATVPSTAPAPAPDQHQHHHH